MILLNAGHEALNPMLDLALAVAHHLIVFALFGILSAELIAVRRGMTWKTTTAVAALDAWYGVLAAAILIVGFARAVFAAKGWAYYSHNGFFWAKIITFLAIGLLSVSPTIRFIQWRKSGQLPAAAGVDRTRRFLYAELALFALLPVWAAAMARGYGEFR
jgi:putative membrane protein